MVKDFITTGDHKIDPQRLPRHIAIIMDGNGRWANERGMPRMNGHRHGVKALKEVVRGCRDIGIEVLTVYAFSTENWNRPAREVTFLMKLLEEVIDNELEELHQNNVQVRIVGRRNGFSRKLLEKIEWGEARTRGNTGLILNVCFNYGGRAEIIDAVNEVIKLIDEGKLSRDQPISEQTFSALVYTRGLPDPDLLIRTGGEYRLSNFLLWQLAYSEIWLTDVCWPDFGREQLNEAIIDFQCRKRRFGGL